MSSITGYGANNTIAGYGTNNDVASYGIGVLKMINQVLYFDFGHNAGGVGASPSNYNSFTQLDRAVSGEILADAISIAGDTTGISVTNVALFQGSADPGVANLSTTHEDYGIISGLDSGGNPRHYIARDNWNIQNSGAEAPAHIRFGGFEPNESGIEVVVWGARGATGSRTGKFAVHPVLSGGQLSPAGDFDPDVSAIGASGRHDAVNGGVAAPLVMDVSADSSGNLEFYADSLTSSHFCYLSFMRIKRSVGVDTEVPVSSDSGVSQEYLNSTNLPEGRDFGTKRYQDDGDIIGNYIHTDFPNR